MNIEDIKNATKDTEPYYFSEKNLALWGQTLAEFTVTPCADGRYRIAAPIRNPQTIYGHPCPFTETVRYFNPSTNRLDAK